jgi:hypothetical protein
MLSELDIIRFLSINISSKVALSGGRTDWAIESFGRGLRKVFFLLLLGILANCKSENIHIKTKVF